MAMWAIFAAPLLMSVDLRTINTETYGTRDEYDVIDFPLRFAVSIYNAAISGLLAYATTGRSHRLAAHLRLQMRRI